MDAACGHWMRAAGVPCGRPAGHKPPHRPATHETEPGRRVRGLTARDLAYREKLGVELDQTLPAAAGATHVGAGETPTPRVRSRRGRGPGPVTTSSGEPARKQATGRQQKETPAAAAGAKVAARYPGTCGACDRSYPEGAPLGWVGSGWGHEVCSEIVAETEKIRSGETFRSQRASTWRRGAGPGKTRDRF